MEVTLITTNQVVWNFQNFVALIRNISDNHLTLSQQDTDSDDVL